MILRAEELKDVCSKILPAVDSDGTLATETLQVQAKDKVFSISVTNKEYFVTVRLEMDEEETFNATVNASLFLKLISQITTDTIALTTSGNTLVVKGNGTYKLPMIFENDSLLELTPIEIINKNVEMNVSGEILLSILQRNGKNMAKMANQVVRPAQKYFYLDEKGAITSIDYECVNSFTLEKPIKVLLSQKVVKLFKLFKEEQVELTLGHDAYSEDIIQTKIRFSTPTVTLTAILSCDDYLINSFPAKQIRECVEKCHNYSTVFQKEELLQAINRFLLFVDKNSRQEDKSCAILEFGQDGVEINGLNNDYKEPVFYTGMLNNISKDYRAKLDLNDLKSCLESSDGAYVTFNFGDEASFVLSNGNIKNVVHEWGED